MSDSPKLPASLEHSREVRVRFAPSPTGYFHLGAARTVLFNWLFARQRGGQFIIRIEDTDKERSRPEFEKDILTSIAWLGLDHDEGPDKGGPFAPYRQSERLDIYEKYLKKLLEEEKAYYCFCAKEQLEEDRQAMLAQGMAPKYGGRCRAIGKSESERRREKGEPSVIRFKMPETEVEFTDIIRGKIKFNAASIGDVIIAKNIREPLYNFTVVVDDALMHISHVIRGEEHLSNTPRQIIFGQTLNLPEPKYAHVPLILNPDRSKMSKRYLETALADYRRQGYLPEAIMNFVALLGWHPQDDREILTKENLIRQFDIKRIQKAGAVFNTQKLDWMNAQYIKRLDTRELADRLQGFIPKDWLRNEEKLVKVLDAIRGRLMKLNETSDMAGFFYELPAYSQKLLIWPRGAHDNDARQKIKNNLIFLQEFLTATPVTDFDKNTLEAKLMPQAESRGRGETLWPLRAALSGSAASPGPFEILDVLGKEESLKRIQDAIQKLA